MSVESHQPHSVRYYLSRHRAERRGQHILDLSKKLNRYNTARKTTSLRSNFRTTAFSSSAVYRPTRRRRRRLLGDGDRPSPDRLPILSRSSYPSPSPVSIAMTLSPSSSPSSSDPESGVNRLALPRAGAVAAGDSGVDDDEQTASDDGMSSAGGPRMIPARSRDIATHRRQADAPRWFDIVSRMHNN